MYDCCAVGIRVLYPIWSKEPKIQFGHNRHMVTMRSMDMCNELRHINHAMKADATTPRQPKVLPPTLGKPLRPCQPKTPPPASLLAKYSLSPRPCQPKTRPPTRLLAAYGFPHLIRVGRRVEHPLNARTKQQRQLQRPPQHWQTGAANRRLGSPPVRQWSMPTPSNSSANSSATTTCHRRSGRPGGGIEAQVAEANQDV